MPTDKQFTGHQLEPSGLYFMQARFYDPMVGRFLAPDSIVPDPANPQALNRYSYVYNNPLGYTDPTGHWGSSIRRVIQHWSNATSSIGSRPGSVSSGGEHQPAACGTQDAYGCLSYVGQGPLGDMFPCCDSAANLELFEDVTLEAYRELEAAGYNASGLGWGKAQAVLLFTHGYPVDLSQFPDLRDALAAMGLHGLALMIAGSMNNETSIPPNASMSGASVPKRYTFGQRDHGYRHIQEAGISIPKSIVEGQIMVDFQRRYAATPVSPGTSYRGLKVDVQGITVRYNAHVLPGGRIHIELTFPLYRSKVKMNVERWRKPTEQERGIALHLLRSVDIDPDMRRRLESQVNDRPVRKFHGDECVQFKIPARSACTQDTHGTSGQRGWIEGAARDQDGVPITVTLFITADGNLSELAFVKSSDDQIIHVPDASDFDVLVIS